jgi:hypothetical protein
MGEAFQTVAQEQLADIGTSVGLSVLQMLPLMLARRQNSWLPTLAPRLFAADPRPQRLGELSERSLAPLQ